MSQGGGNRSSGGGGGGGSGITQIDGDSGSTIGPIVAFTTNPGAGLTSNFSVSGATATLNISLSGPSGFTWSVVTTSSAMVQNHGYIVNSASLVTLTMPAVSSVGNIIEVCGINTGNWVVALQGGQSIKYNTSTATTSITSTNPTDTLRILCTVADTQFLVLSSQGNPTIL